MIGVASEVEGGRLISLLVRIIAAVVVGLIVGFGLRSYDLGRGAEWEVSPTQIAAAKASGKAGYETEPGTVAVLPIRSELADILPFKWAGAGLAAAALLFVATRHIRRKGDSA